MINIVLFEPEIPQNTGNIMRTCVAINAKLHLIKPLGFSLDEKSIKRSAVNYIDKLDYEVYENIEEFFLNNKGEYFFLTRYATKKYSDFDFKIKNDIFFIFGKESTGIPKEILKNHLDQCLRIPTTENVRSLNLSNCVSIVAFEALRQREFENLLVYDKFKGENYLTD